MTIGPQKRYDVVKEIIKQEGKAKLLCYMEQKFWIGCGEQQIFQKRSNQKGTNTRDHTERIICIYGPYYRQEYSYGQ